MCLNPLKRVNSILTIIFRLGLRHIISKVSIPSNGSIQFLPTQVKNFYQRDPGLNPLKRVNSILTVPKGTEDEMMECLNPLKRVNSILTDNSQDWLLRKYRSVSIPSNGSIQFLRFVISIKIDEKDLESQSPQTGQFNSYIIIDTRSR